jgi:cyclophilin family peptidyl-prolyl cis-trans isomerase
MKDKIESFKKDQNNDSLVVYLKKLDDAIDIEYQKQPHYTFKPEHRELYKTIGGTPHLDSQYTIFGEVIDGLEVIDRIAAVEKNKDDRPLIDLRMQIRIISE